MRNGYFIELNNSWMWCLHRDVRTYCNLGNNKFRKNNFVYRKKYRITERPCSRKCPSQKIPRVPRMRTTTRATRYEWKKVPNGIVELRLWWYWRKFRGKSGHRLAASRCHSCENPKIRRYCTLGTTYISSLTHIHTHACELIFPILLFECSDGSDLITSPSKRKWSLFFFSRAIRDIHDACSCQFDRGGLLGRLISIAQGPHNLFVSGLSFFRTKKLQKYLRDWKNK